MTNDEQISRIEQYEAMMREAEVLLQGGDRSPETLARLRELTRALEAYYTGGAWMRDFEADEAGLLPKDLPRGVLSEDGIYDLLETFGELETESAILETDRLILRPWVESDAEECFRYAQDPRVGPAAGWPVHADVEESRRVIREILAVPETYAIVWKQSGQPIGAVGLNFKTAAAPESDEAELGYWLGVPWWGRGIMPEAARALLRHAFEDLGLARVWCCYFDGNDKSRRVQEKLGFRYRKSIPDFPVPQLGETRTNHVNCLTAAEWRALQEQQRGIGSRILVLGCSGAGKSVFARRLQEKTGLPLIHLDNIWWKPDRTHISRAEFDRRLAEIVRGDAWILDGNYSRTYEPRIRACDTVIFLDYSEDTCMQGITERVGEDRPDMPWTEQALDPELVELVRSFQSEARPKLLALLEQFPDKQVVTFRSRAEAEAWLSEL